MEELFVINSKGEKEPFSKEKVKQSALRVGAAEKSAEEIAEKIDQEAYPGIKTSEVFSKVKSFLKKEAPRAAIRFNVKKAMRKLGPTGFPFEKFAGELLKTDGWTLSYNKIIEGKCTDYEIDFVAEKDQRVLIGECKYRNDASKKVDICTALTSWARFLDIREGGFKKGKEMEAILVTNEKFTTKAVAYSECVGMRLLGWRYPKEGGLERYIDHKALYPITILPSFKKDLVPFFAEKRKMLAKDVLNLDIKSLAKKSRLSLSSLEKLREEAELLLQ